MGSGRMAPSKAKSGPTLRPDSRLAFRRQVRQTHGTHGTQGIIFADAPQIWTPLEVKFARENTSSFFDQLNSVFDTKYNILDLLSDHINKYDTL